MMFKLTEEEAKELYGLLSELRVHGNYPYRCAYCEAFKGHDKDCILSKYLDKLSVFVRSLPLKDAGYP